MEPIHASHPADQGSSPQETILQLLQGFAVTQALYVATKLGIADHLQHGPQSCTSLAEQTGTNADALCRLLRALASMGIFTETAPAVFDLTPLALCLQTDSPQSLRNFILFRTEQDYVYWQHALYTIRTGESAFEHTFGVERFAYFQQHPEIKDHFHRGMGEVSVLNDTALIAAYDFTGMQTVIDIGGSHGTRLATLLEHYPTLRGILFEQATTLEQAQKSLRAGGVLDRCDLVAGDWFTSIPTGGDAYLLSILHRWNDARCLTLLTNCHQAMSPTARLLILERVITPTTPWRIHLADLNMLLSSSGQIRTDSAFQELLTRAGFTLTRIIPTDSAISIIEATPR
ncbi:MAG: methyltransferase [Chloroflexaceae bacterium]|nr:methyltransferase [Chloroflexaceae bacterium]